jgi:iron-sulfur cluster assembly protein
MLAMVGIGACADREFGGTSWHQLGYLLRMDSRAESDVHIMQQLGLSLTLTPRSGEAILRAVAAAGMGADGGGLRITARNGRRGREYRFSVEAQPAETDYVVEQHGARVYVDPFSAQDLDGGAVDYVAAGEEYVFTLTPPRLTSRVPKLVA